MLRRNRTVIGLLTLFALFLTTGWAAKNLDINPKYAVGEKIDSLHGVAVYYNGGTGHVDGRNTSAEGYNIGLRYQCVEFVKRYYYEQYNHKMPNTYGGCCTTQKE